MRYAETLTASPSRLPRVLVPGLHGLWWETGLIVCVAALVLLAMAQPAFGYFFFGEDFLYLGQLRAHGNDFWTAVLSPTDNIFFRPVFSATNLLWHMVLPLDPLAHHVRNFAFSVLNLALLHRVLVRLVASAWARALALFFFALSKAHLVAIGYINVYDSIISLMLLLLTVLFWLRYAAQRRWYDYAAGLVFCFFAIFTKDYGLVVVVVVGALVAFVATTPADWGSQVRWWTVRLSPLPLMVLLYLGARLQIVGPLPTPGTGLANPAYTPALDGWLTGLKLLIFTSTMANLSFGGSGTTGAGGLGYAVQPALRQMGLDGRWVDAVLYVGFLGMVIVTLYRGRRVGWPLLFPLVWIAAYFGPTLLTRNIQLYYMYEPLAGAAVLLGMCLAQATRGLLHTWVATLCLIGLNGAINNYASLYHWEFVASRAQLADQAIVGLYRGAPLESLTLVTAQRPFWEYTLMGDFKGPMLPERLGRPDLKVRFADRAELPARAAAADERNPVFDLDNEFLAYPARSDQATAQAEGPAERLRLVLLRPSVTQAGVPFGVQPDGAVALSVDTENAVAGTRIMWDGIPLDTAYGGASLLTAIVPPELFAVPGRHEVYLQQGTRESNRLEFVVEP